MTSQPTKQVCVRLPLDVEKKLKEMAKEDGRSLSNMIAWLLGQIIEKKETIIT